MNARDRRDAEKRHASCRMSRKDDERQIAEDEPANDKTKDEKRHTGSLIMRWPGAPARLEMLLGDDCISLSKPGAELRINLGGRHKAEVVNMVPGRDRLDPAEAWVW